VSGFIGGNTGNERVGRFACDGEALSFFLRGVLVVEPASLSLESLELLSLELDDDESLELELDDR